VSYYIAGDKNYNADSVIITDALIKALKNAQADAWCAIIEAASKSLCMEMCRTMVQSISESTAEHILAETIFEFAKTSLSFDTKWTLENGE
jgi:hypothetical protein